MDRRDDPRKARRQEIINRLGGVCVDCKTNELTLRVTPTKTADIDSTTLANLTDNAQFEKKLEHFILLCARCKVIRRT